MSSMEEDVDSTSSGNDAHETESEVSDVPLTPPPAVDVTKGRRQLHVKMNYLDILAVSSFLLGLVLDVSFFGMKTFTLFTMCIDAVDLNMAFRTRPAEFLPSHSVRTLLSMEKTYNKANNNNGMRFKLMAIYLVISAVVLKYLGGIFSSFIFLGPDPLSFIPMPTTFMIMLFLCGFTAVQLSPHDILFERVQNNFFYAAALNFGGGVYKTRKLILYANFAFGNKFDIIWSIVYVISEMELGSIVREFEPRFLDMLINRHKSFVEILLEFEKDLVGKLIAFDGLSDALAAIVLYSTHVEHTHSIAIDRVGKAMVFIGLALYRWQRSPWRKFMAVDLDKLLYAILVKHDFSEARRIATTTELHLSIDNSGVDFGEVIEPVFDAFSAMKTSLYHNRAGWSLVLASGFVAASMLFSPLHEEIMIPALLMIHMIDFAMNSSAKSSAEFQRGIFEAYVMFWIVFVPFNFDVFKRVLKVTHGEFVLIDKQHFSKTLVLLEKIVRRMVLFYISFPFQRTIDKHPENLVLMFIEEIQKKFWEMIGKFRSPNGIQGVLSAVSEKKISRNFLERESSPNVADETDDESEILDIKSSTFKRKTD